MIDTTVPSSHAVEDLRGAVPDRQIAPLKFEAGFDEQEPADHAVKDKDIAHRRKWFP
jgi:hypothetical protein